MSSQPLIITLDMAGTTVSDDGVVEDAFGAAWHEIPELQSGTEEDVRAFARKTMGQSKISVFTELTGNAQAAERANTVFERFYADAVRAGKITEIPGAEATIRSLKAEGHRVAFTTGFARVTQDLILESLGWKDLADLALVPADAGRGRPWPDLNLTALIRLGDSIRNLVSVGDTPSDMLSGARAGAGRVVGVLTGGTPQEALETAGATDIMGSVAELGTLLS